MTTEVHVSISGNKAVHVINGASQKIMQPGSHHTFLIHGDINLSIAEIAEIGECIPWEKRSVLVEDFVKE